MLAATVAAPARAQNAEIVVTARKATENAQDVPISITTITGQQFESAGLEELTDIAKVTPNFVVNPSGAAGGLYSNLTIRGQTAGFLTLNADQAVGISIDGAPITRGTGLFSNLFDVEQIEVLKGPQGTLYGKNTTGGQINISTRAPQLNELGGHSKFTVGNFNRTDGEIVVNLPLVTDILAVRVGGQLAHHDGYGVGAGTGRELDDKEQVSLRGSILFEPSSGASIRVNSYYNDTDTGSIINRSLVSVFGGAVALKTTDPNFYAGNDFRAPRPFANSREWGVNGTASVDVGSAQLTSITSYRSQDAATRLQSSPSTEIFLGQDSHLFAQEVRLNGKAVDGRLEWQVGGFYSNESGKDIDNLPGFNRLQTTAARNKTFAVFTQGNFALTDQLNVTLGVRYTDEKRKVRELSVGAKIPQAKASFDAFSWTGGLNYQPTPDALLYVSASRGFRSGGIDQDNLATIVKPEYVNNYESGFKLDVLDNRLRLNGAAYYSKYRNIQRTSFDPNNFPATILRNAAKATLYGFEFEAVATPVPGLSLGGTLGYTHGKYDEFIDGPTDRSNEPIGGPKWQYSLSGRYDFPVSGNTRLGFQANYFWVDSVLLTRPAVAAILGRKLSTLNSYGLLNAQIDLDFDVLNGFNLAVFGTNILKEEYFTGGIVVPIRLAPGGIVSNRIVGEPRTYGIRGTWTF